MAFSSEAKTAFWEGSTCEFGHHRAPSQAIPEIRECKAQGPRRRI